MAICVFLSSLVSSVISQGYAIPRANAPDSTKTKKGGPSWRAGCEDEVLQLPEELFPADKVFVFRVGDDNYVLVMLERCL